MGSFGGRNSANVRKLAENQGIVEIYFTIVPKICIRERYVYPVISSLPGGVVRGDRLR